jgi:Xaa-Pro aminopeptidase
VIIERDGSLSEAAAGLLKKIKGLKKAAVEASISVSEYESLREKVKGRIRAVGNIIEQCRSIKEPSEVAAIRTAGRIATKALGRVRRYVRTGMSENELAGRLDFEIRKLGAFSSFETIVAFGANASRPHHKPGGRKLKKNDTILIDFGVRYKNYCCDLTRCFAVGKVSGFYKKVYEAVKEAQAAAIKMVRAGVEIKMVDSAAREVIKRYDLPVYGHGTGHGLGLEVHELPVVAKKIKGKLQAGQVLTIEPGVYIPGKLGVRIEDDVLVTKTGCKILSV